MWKVTTVRRNREDKYGDQEAVITSTLYFEGRVMAEKTGELGVASLNELAEDYNASGYLPPEPVTCMIDLSPEQRKKAMVKNDSTPDLPWFGAPIKRDADGNVIQEEENDKAELRP